MKSQIDKVSIDLHYYLTFTIARRVGEVEFATLAIFLTLHNEWYASC